MHSSPEKKTEGLFAGLSKWSKDKVDYRSGPANGAAGGKGSQVSQNRYWARSEYTSNILRCTGTF